MHPLFDALPPAESITKEDIQCLEDVRLFRQDSWQWEELHRGRCTTSKAVLALGFLEPNSSRALGITHRLIDKGVTYAYHRMAEDALRTLDDMKSLCEANNAVDTRPPFLNNSNNNNKDMQRKNEKIWYGGRSRVNPPFAALYRGFVSKEARLARREDLTHVPKEILASIARRAWGVAQEPTAVLTALNYFCAQDKGIRIKEVGLCGVGQSFNHTTKTSNLLVGASPDGLIQYSNGTIEALEVKNHCPFYLSGQSDPSAGLFEVRSFGWKKPWLLPLYIPQVMLEMMCVGPECRSAVMVRLSATRGAAIVRIHRDDGWLEEMKYWLNKFQTEFVDKAVPPHENFFWNDERGGDRYRSFLSQTKNLQSKVELVDIVEHKAIQRAHWASISEASLFIRQEEAEN